MERIEQSPTLANGNGKKRQLTQEEVSAKLQGNLEFNIFFSSPQMKPGTTDWRELAKFVGIPEDEAAEYREMLVSTKLWVEKPTGIEKIVDQLDLGDLAVSDFLKMSLSVIARLSENGPCQYETLVVPTTQKLKREFYRKVNLAFREFIESSSARTDYDSILAWTHAGLEVMGPAKKEMSEQ